MTEAPGEAERTSAGTPEAVAQLQRATPGVETLPVAG